MTTFSNRGILALINVTWSNPSVPQGPRRTGTGAGPPHLDPLAVAVFGMLVTVVSAMAHGAAKQRVGVPKDQSGVRRGHRGMLPTDAEHQLKLSPSG